MRRASVDVLAALTAEHLQGASTASSGFSQFAIRACAEDVVLLHHSDAQGSQQEWQDSPQQALAKQYDASLIAMTATLFGPGALRWISVIL